jgi:S-DNA-T family DNA segregation ATPase FtsK/SpoIIIE
MEDIEKRATQTGTSSGKGSASDTGAAVNDSELEGDDMHPAAVDVILETNQASVSMLQRRLKLGYARAARIVDEMEEKGIVGPFQGSKPREILITKEQWAAMRGGQSEQMMLDDVPFDEGVPEELD